jgi:hypothetical protein
LTLVLLDTNAYLRLAKRIRPMLGVTFGQKGYVLAILKQVEDEVHGSSRLRFLYPWFDAPELSNERLAARVRTSVLRAHVLGNATAYTSQGRSPPSPTDCFILAFGQIRPAIVATDDLGMHLLAKDFSIPVWHGHELLKKMLSAKLIDNARVRDIYEAVENNSDLPGSWRAAKHTAFKKVFGPAP